MNSCYHCGNEALEEEQIFFDEKIFCCNGCQTVYEILSSNQLTDYYSLENTPGITPKAFGKEKFQYLENEEIVEKLLDFQDGDVSIVHLQVPQIHCSSCVWILEHLFKLNPNIGFSQVEFSKKKVVLHFNHNKTNLKEIVELMASLGYEPYISLEQAEKKKVWVDRSLIYKIGVAFFSFGNIMLLSFPEYFGVEDIWMDEYRNFFRYLNVFLALPVFFYSASPYFQAAYYSLKHKKLNIDVPMALGILVMFVRSMVDIFILDGPGFLDSMCGLVFFMLSGKLIQQTSYNYLSFERDYKSYFPIAVTKLEGKNEVPIQVFDIQKGDSLLVRNEELIPADSILISEKAYIDYSFVTGEANLVEKKSGDKIYAGGRQMGAAVEILAVNTVSQSYLTELWSNDVFQKNVKPTFENITNQASQIFTPILLSLAGLGFLYWAIWGDWVAAFNVFTAVLIVACPCALALTAPYTWGNIIRILGKKKFYLKNTLVIEQLAKVDTVVFDKTGTLTSTSKNTIRYTGKKLSKAEQAAIKNIVRNSNHPLSRRLYLFVESSEWQHPKNYQEQAGKGISGEVDGNKYRIGSRSWLNISEPTTSDFPQVYIEKNGECLGYFEFENQYRKGLNSLLNQLKSSQHELHLLSGDHDGERRKLEETYPQFIQLTFNQKPSDKLEYIKNLQTQGKNVLMIGDGLNDAGALAQSNVGVSISENINVFTPASDAILDSSVFNKLEAFMRYCQNGIRTVKMSYGLAIIYNIVGISFALTHQLSPLVAAIIMPLSTVTIISFVTIMSHRFAKRF